MYRTIKDIDPDMPVLGYKTARGPLMWYSNQWADVSGYCDITSSLAMPGISTFEAVPQPSIVSLCEYWEWPSGGWPHYPFYRGPWQRNNSWTEDLYSVQKAAYARIVKEIFDGSKSIFMEDYSATAPHGGCEYHYFHRKKHYRELDQQKKCIGWNDQPVVYTPDENKEPDVSIERKTLELARAYQLCYRLAPLFLPAKKPKAETGILATYETRFTPGGKWAFLEAVPALVDLLDRIHAPCEVVTGYQRDEINRFKVLFVTFAATLLDADLANRLKIFVRKGGTLVFIQGAGRYDLNTAREGNREPLFGLDTFLCARADRSIVPNFEKPILLKDGSTLPTYEWPPQFSVGQIPWIGSLPPHRFESTGVLSLLPGGSVIGAMDGHPAIISANKGRTISMICPQLQIIDRLAAPFDATWRAFFNAILVRAGVKKPVEISSSANTHLLDPAILEGNGYWLAAVVNYGSQKQHCRVRFSFLPKGTYDITDVTGEKPIIVKDKKGQKRLKIDRNGRKTRFVAESANAFVLKSQGLSLAIGPRKAMVLLVRKAGEPVLVNAPVFSIQALCNKPAYVVIDKTTSKQCHKAIEKLECVFRNRKIPARFMAPEDIKMRKTSFTVELDGVRLELFRNQPLKTNRNLIIIGTTRNNPLAAHIEKPEVFTYDKVLEKVTRLYPGKGRGIIQLVESINSPAYDSTGKCRHALLVQGSDTAGTMRAIETLTRLLT
ncbi:MAG: hypothetical protein A2487_06860 [Candidatus Raymondbacteria bacterium RifOxyC12_full_50_8]|nr:MAG: hypothetical protein A2487_06860 [Candidatus Raymondbacteria bacterium RifOxyC12_full_50_8]